MKGKPASFCGLVHLSTKKVKHVHETSQIQALFLLLHKVLESQIIMFLSVLQQLQFRYPGQDSLWLTRHQQHRTNI